MKVIGKYHPEAEASCDTGAHDYDNLIWTTAAIPKATLDAEWLDYYKSVKNEAIDKRTRDLIVSGITYNGVLFSSSETAQRNWLALDQFKSFHTYPVAVTAEDDSEHTFADATEVNTFVLTGMSIINGHYASGRALKIQVNAATDEAGVDAVVDNR